MKKILFTLLLFITSFVIFAQDKPDILKGNLIFKPTTGYGADTAFAYIIKNGNSAGQAGFVGIVGNDTMYLTISSDSIRLYGTKPIGYTTATQLGAKADTSITITNASNGYMAVAGNNNKSLRTNLTVAVDTAVAFNGIKTTLGAKADSSAVGLLATSNIWTKSNEFQQGILLATNNSFVATPRIYGSSLGPNITTSSGFGINSTAGAWLFSVSSASKIGIGLSTGTGSYDLSFIGTAAKTIGLNRHTTANTAGNNLTINSGGATSGANRKDGGNLILQTGISTGAGFSSISLQRSTRLVVGTTPTTDNSLTDAVIVFSEKNLVDNTNDTICSISIVATQTDSTIAARLVFGVLATNDTDVQSENGAIDLVGVVKDGVAVVSNTPVFSQAVSTGTLTGTWVLTWNNTAKLFYVIVKYDSSLDPTAGKMKLMGTLFNNCRGAVTQF